MPGQAQAKQEREYRRSEVGNHGDVVIDITPLVNRAEGLQERNHRLEKEIERLENRLEDEREITRNQKETIRELKESAARIKAIRDQKEKIKRLFKGISSHSLDPSDPNGFYAMFGLATDDFKGKSESQIQTAISKLRQGFACLHHPDRGNGGNEEKMKEINEAHEFLKDPKKRDEYAREIL